MAVQVRVLSLPISSLRMGIFFCLTAGKTASKMYALNGIGEGGSPSSFWR